MWFIVFFNVTCYMCTNNCIATVNSFTSQVTLSTVISVAVLLKFWAHEILPKCWRKFRRNGENLGIILEKYRHPLPHKKRNVRIFIYCAVQILHSCRNLDKIPLEILISADLNYFNGGMFNCLQVIWLGLCDTNRV